MENLAGAEAVGGDRLTVVEGDIRDPALVRDVTAGIDLVFHLAAIRITQCAEEPRLAYEVLVDGTFNVVEAAAAAGVRKVIASSSASVYGLAEAFPTTERHHPYNNDTFYGAAKAFNEGMLRSFHAMYGLDYVALRYFNVYGPRMDIHGLYTEVLIRWMERIAARRAAADPRRRRGRRWTSCTSRDIARANILAARGRRHRRRLQHRQRHGDQPQGAGRRPARASWARTCARARPDAGGQRGHPPARRHLRRGQRTSAYRRDRPRGGPARPCRLVAPARRRQSQAESMRPRCSEAPMIPVMRPLLGEEEAQAAADAVRSGWVAQGPRVAEFEKAFAASVGAAHGVARRPAPRRCISRCSCSASDRATR